MEKNVFTKLKHPFLFQGNTQLPHYFEGWYFKQVNGALNKTISFIFGISTNKENPHAFIQVIHSHPLKTYYFSYPLESFMVYEDGYQLGSSTYSEKHCLFICLPFKKPFLMIFGSVMPHKGQKA